MNGCSGALGSFHGEKSRTRGYFLRNFLKLVLYALTEGIFRLPLRSHLRVKVIIGRMCAFLTAFSHVDAT